MIDLCLYVHESSDDAILCCLGIIHFSSLPNPFLKYVIHLIQYNSWARQYYNVLLLCIAPDPWEVRNPRIWPLPETFEHIAIIGTPFPERSQGDPLLLMFITIILDLVSGLTDTLENMHYRWGEVHTEIHDSVLGCCNDIW